MANAQPTWQVQLGLAKETTWGTGVTATTALPVKGIKFTPVYEEIIDDGYRDLRSVSQAYYQGSGKTEIDTGPMLFYPDDSGHLLMGLFGVDTITGAGPTYTHTLTLQNVTPGAPSYTLTKFDGLAATAEQVTGCHWNETAIKFVNPGKLTIQSKALGKIQGSVSKPALSYSSAGVFLPWQGSLTLNSVGTYAKLIDAEITIKQLVDHWFGVNNTQDATDFSIGGMEVTGKLTFVSQDMTELNFYLNNTQPPFSIIFTSGTNTWTIQMTKMAGTAAELDHGQPAARTVFTFKAITNSTDAGTGNAPIKSVLVNSKSSAY